MEMDPSTTCSIPAKNAETTPAITAVVVVATAAAATMSSVSAGSAASIAPYATDLNGVNGVQNELDKTLLWCSLGGLCVLILGLRIWQSTVAQCRHMHGVSAQNDQRFWARNASTTYPWLKKNLIYAPLWKKRHNREVQLSSLINMGTLPGRSHAIMLTLYLISNIVYSAWLDYGANPWANIAELRGRTGTLAVANMVALVILAGRNNPLIALLKVSFDTYNLLHRWIGRIIVLEAIVHTCAWATVKVAASSWDGLNLTLRTDSFAIWGAVGTIAMLMILIASPGPVRHAFYETFLTTHIIMAFLAFLGVYVHCDIGKLPQVVWMKCVFIFWLTDRLLRIARLVRNSVSREGLCRASIESLPGEACRVTFQLPRRIDIKPGTHAYLRFGSIKFWESHPFSIAWVDHIPKKSTLPNIEKMRLVQKKSQMRTEVSFIIHAQTGMTRRLYEAAQACKGNRLYLRAGLEGPYAGHHSLDSYGHALLIAGASGITHQVMFVRHLLHGFNEGLVATQRITLVWIVRDIEHLEWVRPWMDQILQMHSRRDILKIKLFVTRPKNSQEVSSPSTTVQMFPGRPDIDMLVRQEVEEQIGAMCVTVCGPGGLADNVRAAVRDNQEDTVVDFIEESFTW